MLGGPRVMGFFLEQDQGGIRVPTRLGSTRQCAGPSWSTPLGPWTFR